MGKRRGRPKKNDSGTEQYRLRMNKEEIFWLNQLCKNEGLTKADALRTLIKMGYDMSKNGAFNGYPKNVEGDSAINVYPINEEEDEDFLVN